MNLGAACLWWSVFTLDDTDDRVVDLGDEDDAGRVADGAFPVVAGSLVGLGLELAWAQEIAVARTPRVEIRRHDGRNVVGRRRANLHARCMARNRWTSAQIDRLLRMHRYLGGN
ncbi:MAG: hypothetical protein ABIQ73_17245 [Acidimicrobiales bacterium]